MARVLARFWIPAALVPEGAGKGGGQQQGQAAIPGMGGQVEIGVFKVPQVVGQDVQPDHIRPKHILLLFGGIDPPPARHAQDVHNARDAVEPIPPAAIEPHVFRGEPPPVAKLLHGLGALDAGLEIAGHRNEDIKGHDGKGEHLEPFGFAHAPLILEHHEADAACGGGIELCIMEPAVHVGIGLVGQGHSAPRAAPM